MIRHMLLPLALLLSFVAPRATLAQHAVALVGGTLLDGTGAAPIADAVVVARDGRIACAGPARACAVTGDVAVVDVSGRWIVPGLVDAHVHYSQTGWVDGRPDALDLRERFPYEETIAELETPEPFYRSYLCSGVTATFDVGGYPWTWGLREPAGHSTSAPHVAAAGPLLSTRDHWLNQPAERQFLWIDSDSAVTRGVSYLAANETDAVKVWFLVSATSPDTASWVGLLQQAGVEAERMGLPLIVHATTLWGAKQAVRAGADLLVHGVFDRPVDDEFLALARAAGTIYTPTIVVGDGYRQIRARDFEAERYGDALDCVDPETLHKAFLTDSLPGGATEAERARMRAASEDAFRIQAENVRRVHEAGIPIAVGTDAGNPLTLHGPALYLEMEALQRAGLEPVEVLAAATRTAARAMGMLAEIGTIERGKVADLLVLARDPTADTSNLRSVLLIMRNGRVWTRDELEYR
ncbi:MAG: amidohydrolase family protein [Longimicrobiales bacterium]